MSIHSIAEVIEDVLATAKKVTDAIPGLSSISPLIGVGEKFIGIIDDLTDSAPDNRTQQEMQQTRKELAAAVSARANALADRLDG